MLFYGINEALQKGERVCIATPRTDVVLELAPRLQEVFPYIKVAALYGGSVDKEKDAVLVVATTHQLLRYYRAFHVIVVDEIDAFPYCADQMLQYAVKQAMKEKAARIYLTATPDETWKRKFRKGEQKVLLFLDDITVIRCQFLYFAGAEIGRKASTVKEFLEFYYNG